jgi:hypothetical protein
MDLKTLRALGKSPNLADLQRLDLGQTSFSLKGWDEVLRWPFLPKLKWLRMHYARQVNPPSIYTVAEIQSLPKYRRAFDKLVPDIDWESWTVSPWNGNASWKGLSWSGLRRRHLFAMWPFVQKKDYDGLESAYRADCVAFAGEEAAKAIDELSFAKYEKSLAAGLKWAVRAADRDDATAVYLRMRPDLQWEGEFHVCGDAQIEPFEPREEYSYGGPLDERNGPSFPEAAEARRKFATDNPLDPGAAQHYLLARTVAAFGRAATKHKFPVPVFFSCMYAVFRVSEGK